MIFPETKLKLLKELAKKDLAPSELARKLGLSVPAIFKHLKELEAANFVKKIGLKPGKTRPFANYSLGEGFVLFVQALRHEVRETFLEVDENLKLHLRIWSIPQSEFHYYVEKFWWKLEEYMGCIEAVAVYGSVARGEARQDSDIDILILVNKGAKRLDKKFGALMIKKGHAARMVLSQIFSVDDFRKALERESKFAQQAVKDKIILYDPRGRFRRLE